MFVVKRWVAASRPPGLREYAALGRTRRRKTTVDQTLIRGLATAGPMFVLGLSLSQNR
jgi:hypothetical protein